MLEKVRDFNILNKIGEGGMGEVFLAEDENLGRKVAIKVLSPQLARDPQLVDRFKQEARVQAGLIHPNIVALHNFFSEDGNYYMVMEFAEGKTLKEIISLNGAIPEDQAVSIFLQMLDGVGYAHSLGIIHRDIKPANIIISNGGKVKLMDFGIAKILGDKGLTKTGSKMGTVYYMSPEQIRAAKDIDQRTDIYSLGITFYEMLTGKLPFNSNTESDFEIMEEIIHGTFPNIKIIIPSVSDYAIKALDKMTMKEKNYRYATCYQCSEELNGNLISSTILNQKTYRSSGIINEPLSMVNNENKASVIIGSQTWMIKNLNLNIDHYRNGDLIPQVKEAGIWTSIKTGAWCYYNNDPENGKKYGKLYNWYAVNDPRGLAPLGLHIPSKKEFEALLLYVNNNANALKEIGQGTGIGSGTNISGFSALFAGYRYDDGDFYNLEKYTNLWCSTEENVSDACSISLHYNDNDFSLLSRYNKGLGFSVRCIKD